jgi:nucleoside-diphosphate-sugar epimerase
VKVLITGATGTIGPNVVCTFEKNGYQIRTFSADSPTEGIFSRNMEVIVGDVTDLEAVRSALEGVDAVVHMAGLLHIVNPTPEVCEKYEHINVGGTTTVVDAAIKAGVKRVVLFSTIAVYGPSDGYVLNEMSPTNPDTYYAQAKYAAEQIVLNARGADGQPLGTVLRLGAVYGSRIKGNYERMVRALARNRFIPVGDGRNRRTLVYDKDVGCAAVQAVSHPAATGKLFNVTDGGFHTLNEIIDAICSGLGRTSPRLSLPVGPMRIVAGLIEKGAKTIGIKAPVTRETIDKYNEDIAVDGGLIQKELSFVPRYDLKTGWKEAIREMRERSVL